MNELNTWNDMILKTHFQSLNPTWNDQESVITLLHEIAQRMKDPDEITAEERNSYLNRIQVFIKVPLHRKQPMPMKAVESKKMENQSKKTGS